MSLFFYNTGLSTPEEKTLLVIVTALHTDRQIDGRINHSHILKNMRMISRGGGGGLDIGLVHVLLSTADVAVGRITILSCKNHI